MPFVLYPQRGRDDVLSADPVGTGDGHEGKWSQPLCITEARGGGLMSQQASCLQQLALFLFSRSTWDCWVWGARRGLKQFFFFYHWSVVFECLLKQHVYQSVFLFKSTLALSLLSRVICTHWMIFMACHCQHCHKWIYRLWVAVFTERQ